MPTKRGGRLGQAVLWRSCQAFSMVESSFGQQHLHHSAGSYTLQLTPNWTAFCPSDSCGLKPPGTLVLLKIELVFSGVNSDSWSCLKSVYGFLSNCIILTAPWYISTSLSPKYGICLKGLMEMSTGPIYVWRGYILKNIQVKQIAPIYYYPLWNARCS